MTPNEAEKIVDSYASLLLRGVPEDCTLRQLSWLDYPPELIMQAMKLELALSVVLLALQLMNSSTITDEWRVLPEFIDDNEARRLEVIHKEWKIFRKRQEPIPMELRIALEEVFKCQSKAMESGLRLWAELVDFVNSVKRFDVDDSLYWQKILALAGIEYSPEKELVLSTWLHQHINARQ